MAILDTIGFLQRLCQAMSSQISAIRDRRALSCRDKPVRLPRDDRRMYRMGYAFAAAGRHGGRPLQRGWNRGFVLRTVEGVMAYDEGLATRVRETIGGEP